MGTLVPSHLHSELFYDPYTVTLKESMKKYVTKYKRPAFDLCSNFRNTQRHMHMNVRENDEVYIRVIHF